MLPDVLERSRQLIGQNEVHAAVAVLLGYRHKIASESADASSTLEVLDARISPLLRELESNRYAALGLKPKASDAEVRKAYKKLALKYHPDKSAGTTPLFHCIQSAYDAISNNERDCETKESYSSKFSEAYKQKASQNAANKPPPAPTLPPKNLRATDATTTSITISWTSPATGRSDVSINISCYEIQFKEEYETTWSVASSSIRGLNCQKHNLVSGKVYIFRVRALNASNGEWSPFSEYLSASTMKSVPAKVMIDEVKFYTANNSCRLSWSCASTGTIAYEIQYRQRGENQQWRDFDESGSQKASRNACVIPNLDTSRVYQFRIRARNSQGSGNWSEIAQSQAESKHRTENENSSKGPKIKVIRTKPARITKDNPPLGLKSWSTWETTAF